MNTDKKLGYFAKAIAQEVESKKRQARYQMAAEFNAEISQATASAEAEAKAQYQTQTQAIQKVLQRRIAEAEGESRHRLATQRERLIERFFDQVKAEIKAFRGTPEYETHLINSIQNINTQSRYAIVQLAPDDMPLAETIETATGLTAEKGDIGMIGGFKLLTANRARGINHSIADRLADARHEFEEELKEETPCQKENCAL